MVNDAGGRGMERCFEAYHRLHRNMGSTSLTLTFDESNLLDCSDWASGFQGDSLLVLTW